MQNDLSDLARSDGVSVHRGFPNPALDREDYNNLSLDINQLLIQRPASTYLFRIAGHHWADQGIYDGDVAVIDRALQANANDLIIAWRTSGSIICRQHQLTPDDRPWGIVTAIIHQYR